MTYFGFELVLKDGQIPWRLCEELIALIRFVKG